MSTEPFGSNKKHNIQMAQTNTSTGKFSRASPKAAKISKETTIRVLQWNILADGLGRDGFLSTEFVPIRESSAANAKKYEANQFMQLVREAKIEDTKSGAIQAMNDLKKAEKRLKKIQPTNVQADVVKQEIATMKDTVSKSKLVNLKQQFEHSPELERVDTETLDWNVRYSRIKALLLRTDPDIITFQEMDHLKQFLEDGTFSSKYTCLLDPHDRYQTPYYSEDASKDSRRPENYMTHLLRSKAAFCPKSYSNAYNFRKKRSRPGASDLDDDGVAVFWKKDRFEPMELGFLEYPTKEGESKKEGAIAVTLHHQTSNQLINVLTAHLPSGDDAVKEQERLNVLKNPTVDCVAQRLCRQNDGTWKQVSYEANYKFDGLLSFIHYYTQQDPNQKNPRTVLALDTNSRPTFPLTDASATNSEKTNVWHSILQGSKLESIWVQTSLLDSNGNPTNPRYPFIASVNKMRGPSSDQPSKIGEHQLELIDHIFTNARNSHVVKDVQINEAIRIALAPLQFASKDGKAEVSLNPSMSMPSDHLPVVVDIEL